MRYLLICLLTLSLASCGMRSASYNSSITNDQVIRSRFAQNFFAEGDTSASPFGGGMSGSVSAKTAEVELASTSTAEDRQIVYTAFMTISILNPKSALNTIQEKIDGFGGFLSRSSLNQVIVRIPPANFREFMEAVGKIGQVTEETINSTDVTEQYMDLELRVRVAQKSYDRLITLLEKAVETKDVLEIERDLRRLTEEIEGYKGSLRLLEDQIQYATVTIFFDKKNPIDPFYSGATPFEWIGGLGLSTLYADHGKKSSGPGLFGDGMKLTGNGPHGLPKSFTRLHHKHGEILGTSASNERVRAREIETKDPQSIAFWNQAVRECLENQRGYTLLDTDDDGHLSYTIELEGFKWNYDLWITSNNENSKKLLIIEFGRKTSADEAKPQILEETKEMARFSRP